MREMDAKDAHIRWLLSALERSNREKDAAAAASRERERELTTAVTARQQRERNLEAQIRALKQQIETLNQQIRASSIVRAPTPPEIDNTRAQSPVSEA